MANYAGTTGNDKITGTSGVDTIHDGGGGNDVLKGEGSNDVITVTGGSDTVKGGDEAFQGYDILVVDYSAKTAAVMTLANDVGFAAGPGDKVKHVGIERVSVMGGSGDDSLRGMDSRDTLLGGVGDDTLDGGDGSDTMEGGDGIDTVTYADFEHGVDVDLSQLKAQYGITIDRLVGIERVVGTSGYDTLEGSAGNDTLIGGQGGDELVGRSAGADLLLGENGFDTLRSYGGADTIDGGVETLDGGAHDDLFTISGAGERVVHGGTGDDEMWLDFSSLSTGFVTVAGGYTNNAGTSVSFDGIETLSVLGSTAGDSLLGTRGSDTISGRAGKDTIDGGKGDDSVNIVDGVAKGGAGIDQLIASFASSSTSVTTLSNGFTDGVLTVTQTGFERLIVSGGTAADTLVGGDGDDNLSGNAGNDSLSGGKGADLLAGGLGNDTLVGAQGLDSANYGGIAGAVTVDLGKTVVQDTGAAGLDLLLAIENLTGGAGADTLIGDKEANSLTGGSGADTLLGMAGDDFLDAGVSVTTTANRLDGGSGNDTIRAAEGTGADTLIGGSGVDTLLLLPLSFLGSPTAKVDLAITTAQDTKAGMDTITGFENVIGSGGAETIWGAAGDNRLEGAAGADSLTGREGADTLVGGKGADVQSGGADADRFVYLAVDDSRSGTDFGSIDQITDFDAADLIDLSAIDAVAASDATNEAFSFVAAFTGVAGQATLAYDGGEDETTVRADTNGDSVADFELVAAGELTSGDFIA